MLNRSIETAQKRVEQHNFQIRKRTLEYDDAMNKQREIIYGFRNEVLMQECLDQRQRISGEVTVEKVFQFSLRTRMFKIEPPESSGFSRSNFPIGLQEEI